MPSCALISRAARSISGNSCSPRSTARNSSFGADKGAGRACVSRGFLSNRPCRDFLRSPCKNRLRAIVKKYPFTVATSIRSREVHARTNVSEVMSSAWPRSPERYSAKRKTSGAYFLYSVVKSVIGDSSYSYPAAPHMNNWERFMFGRHLYSEDPAQDVRSGVCDHARSKTSAPQCEQPIQHAEDSNLHGRFHALVAVGCA